VDILDQEKDYLQKVSKLDLRRKHRISILLRKERNNYKIA
jgi:predicted RNA-binding protein